MKAITELTGLRFLAAFYVFLFHLYSNGLLPNLNGKIGAIITQGALGVNLFFVLSGYVLTYSHLHYFRDINLPTWSFMKNFMVKRIARIYPAYLFGLLLYMVIRTSLGELTPYQIVVAGINALMIQTLNPRLAMEWYGGMSWSISVEIFFYLSFPVILPLLLRLRQQILLSILGIIYVCSFLPGLFYNLSGKSFIVFLLSYTFPLFRLPEFITGVILCILVQRFAWSIPEWIAVFMLVVSALYLAFLGPIFSGYIIHNIIIIPTIAVLIGTLVSAKTRLLAWLGSKPMVLLGESSYCFYVVQIPLMFILHTWLQTHPEAVGNVWYGLGVLVLNLVGGYLLHISVEKPSHRLLVTKLVNKPNIKPASIG